MDEKEYQRKYRADNSERLKFLKKRWDAKPENMVRNRLRKLGLPLELAEFVLNHSGFCDICGDPPKWKTLHIDHDHDTNRFRGLICAHCNQGLGHFRDDVVLLDKAKQYLSSFSL